MIRLRTVAGEALRGLLQHRLRAALSGAGLVFGIASVTASLAIADGARASAMADFGVLGTSNVLVRATAGDSAPVLSQADLEAITDVVPGVAAAAATRTATVDCRLGDRRVADATLVGVTANWPLTQHVVLAAGRWPTAADRAAGRRVAVLGADAGEVLFGRASPLGATVQAGTVWYDVIGVAAHRASAPGTPALFDLDRAVVVPFESMDTSQGRHDAPDRARELAITMADPGALDDGAMLVRAILTRRHPDGAGYEIVLPKELVRARLAARRTADIVLLAIGSVALLISGVGIMNIMLANVLERTPEIGVRRAFGARQPDILAQFALESALLCAAGGAAGIPLGAGVAAIAAWAGDWPVLVTAPSVALALGLATAVGVGFGLYPARRAAAIAPVDALRA